MNKSELLFYDAYEEFYHMASNSEVFQRYCKAVYGEDFSQDGFSDVNQIDDIMGLTELKSNQSILDIGCGNGKMVNYIHQKTGANVYGFDYSEQAIRYAMKQFSSQNQTHHFQTGIIGEIEYPANSFDLITSIDTIYFAKDMYAFVKQIMGWLKPNGYFVCGYQEGDVMPKTKNADTTVLATALQQIGIPYTVVDYTKQTYDLLIKKRKVLKSMKQDFYNTQIKMWYRVGYNQSIDKCVSYEKYASKNSRYLYVVQNRKSII